MEEDAEGRVRLVLGDGERELPVDDDVARLCLAMHHAVCPMSPHAIYRCVVDGVEPPLDATFPRTRARSTPPPEDEDDEALLMRLWDVPSTLVTYYWDGVRSPTFGHPRAVLRFETRAEARVAQDLDRRYNVGTADDVWALLCHATPTTRLRRGLLHEHVLPQATLDPDVDPGVAGCVTSGEWTAVTRGDRPSTALHVTWRGRLHRATIAHHEWRGEEHDPTVLAHRALALQGWTLRYVRHAPHGGHVQLDGPTDDDDVWPSWLSEQSHRLPPCESGATVVVVLPSDARLLAKRHVAPEDVHCDARCRKVVARWSKSQRAPCVDASFLLSPLPLVDDRGCPLTARSGLRMLRVRAAEDLRCTAHIVFTNRFGRPYADEMVARCADDDACGVYAAYDGTELVGAFAVVLYSSISADGTRSVCAMIDSFAVLEGCCGRGHGDAMFHEGVRRLTERHTTAARYTLFAQCVRSGDGYRFWYDRLDESSLARSLVIQALHVDPAHVPVQSEAQCTPRAREYVRADSA